VPATRISFLTNDQLIGPSARLVTRLAVRVWLMSPTPGERAARRDTAASSRSPPRLSPGGRATPVRFLGDRQRTRRLRLRTPPADLVSRLTIEFAELRACPLPRLVTRLILAVPYSHPRRTFIPLEPKSFRESAPRTPCCNQAAIFSPDGVPDSRLLPNGLPCSPAIGLQRFLGLRPTTAGGHARESLDFKVSCTRKHAACVLEIARA